MQIHARHSIGARRLVAPVGNSFLAKTSILNGELNTHYSTMTLNDLKALDVKGIADKNCMLFLWVVSPMLKEGIDVMEA